MKRRESESYLAPKSVRACRDIGGSGGGRTRRAPPHLPGILVFDDTLVDLGGRAPPHLPDILVFDDILDILYKIIFL